MSLSLKNRLRSAVHRSAHSDTLYRRVWHPLIRLSALALRERRWQGLAGGENVGDVIARLSPGAVVIDGPFAGMRYPSRQAAGSAYAPKIIGTYEAELHPALADLVRGAPGEVIDVGCAEGYYAVGLARLLPLAHVIAYDTDPHARALCAALAEANGVANRVTVAGTCTGDMLAAGSSRGRRLIIADCEGYEADLFTPAVCRALAGDDLVIEVHDFLVPDLSRRLLPIVSATHDVTRVPSVTDFARPSVFRPAVLAGLEDDMRVRLMAELRPLEMEWFVCRSRRHA